MEKSFSVPPFSIPPPPKVVLVDVYLPTKFQLSSFNPFNFYFRKFKTLNMASVLTSLTPFWVCQIAITENYLHIKSWLSIRNGSKVIKG